MRTWLTEAVPVVAAALGLIVSSPARCQGNAADSAADEVADWNKIMFRAAQTAATPPFVMTRVAAIVQVAVFDAVNGIERRYTPVHGAPGAAAGASQRAAAVAAAYTTLVNLYPTQKTMFDQQLVSSLSAISSAAAVKHSVSIQRGIEWGETVGNAILAWRSTDGFSPPPPPFVGGTEAGQWRPTPPLFLPGAGPQFAYMTPWVIQSPQQFRSPGPPPLTSARYTADFEEVKTLGSLDSAVRTEDQTLLARFWQSTTPNYIFDHAALELADARHLTFSEKAWLLGLLNTALADAAIACWEAKYHYVFWRPITAIQLGETDGNPSTAADPEWLPLLVTPAIPDYPSGHTTVSGAAVAVLSTYFGEGSHVKLVSDAPAMAGVIRSFTSFSAVAAEISDARVLAGIHFRTADADGHATGVAVAKYVIDNAFLRVNRH
jgi:membrane-associated phospholipid phosphatase